MKIRKDDDLLGLDAVVVGETPDRVRASPRNKGGSLLIWIQSKVMVTDGADEVNPMDGLIPTGLP